MTTQTHIAYHMEVLRKAQVIRRKNEALQRIQEAKEKEYVEEKLADEQRKEEELERQKLEEAVRKQQKKREMKREISNTSSDFSWVSDRKLYSALHKFAQKVREAKSEPPQPVYTENGLKKYISLQGRRNYNAKTHPEYTRYSRHLPRLHPAKIHPINRYTEFDRQIYPTRHVCFQCWRGFEDSPTYYGKHNPRVHKIDV